MDCCFWSSTVTLVQPRVPTSRRYTTCTASSDSPWSSSRDSPMCRFHDPVTKQRYLSKEVKDQSYKSFSGWVSQECRKKNIVEILFSVAVVMIGTHIRTDTKRARASLLNNDLLNFGAMNHDTLHDLTFLVISHFCITFKSWSCCCPPQYPTLSDTLYSNILLMQRWMQCCLSTPDLILRDRKSCIVPLSSLEDDSLAAGLDRRRCNRWVFAELSVRRWLP